MRARRRGIVGDHRAISHQLRQALLCDLINDHEAESLDAAELTGADAAELTGARQKTAFAEAVTRRKTPQFRLARALAPIYGYDAAHPFGRSSVSSSKRALLLDLYQRGKQWDRVQKLQWRV